SVALGVYVGPGAPAAAATADQTLGGKVTYVLDFLPANTWAQLSDPAPFVQSWRGSTLHFVIGIPMLPTNGGAMAQGAEGDYDPAFSRLAQGLVTAGLGHAVLMVGWQPYSTQNRWRVTTAAAATQYVAYWDHIHQAMAGVPGARFVFEWDAGTVFGDHTDPALTYPGDRDVDIVATDAFDAGLDGVPAAQQWAVLLDQPYGPGWLATFAASHGKSIALAMSGLVPTSANGAGDNADFLGDSVRWAAANHATMDLLWDMGTSAITRAVYPAAASFLAHAVHQGIVSAFPASSSATAAGRVTDGGGTPAS
ncbi:MAG: hypothetical protein ACRDYZ_13795, partial [Acidimicrobiales bacterium]